MEGSYKYPWLSQASCPSVECCYTKLSYVQPQHCWIWSLGTVFFLCYDFSTTLRLRHPLGSHPDTRTGTGFTPIYVTREEFKVHHVPSRTWDSFTAEWVSEITPVVSQGHMADWILLFLITVYSLCTVGFIQYFNLKSPLEVAFRLPWHLPGSLCKALAYWELLTGNGSKDGYTATRGLQTCINY